MDSPGEYLKRERELRGVSTDEVSDFTKVSVNVIKAFETDDYDRLPHPTFVRGFIKAYCKCLGLDDTDAVLRYEVFLKERSEETGPERLEVPGMEPVLPASRTILYISLVFLGLLVIIIFFLLTSKESTVKVDRPEPEQTETIPAQELPLADKEEAAPEQVPGVKEGEEKLDIVGEIEVVPEMRHTLSIMAIERTWIDLRIDDKESKEVLLQPGERITWKSRDSFFLRIGNAGGVHVTFNGEMIGPFGLSGEVVEIRLPGEAGSIPVEVRIPEEPPTGPADRLEGFEDETLGAF